MKKLNTVRLGKLVGVTVHVIAIGLLVNGYSADNRLKRLNALEQPSLVAIYGTQTCPKVAQDSVVFIKNLAKEVNKLPGGTDEELYQEALETCINSRNESLTEQITISRNTKNQGYRIGLSLLIGYWILFGLYNYLFTSTEEKK